MKKAIAATHLLAVVLLGVGWVESAHADSATATFTDRVGDGPIPGATTSLTLNADGTIAATATSLSALGLVGFALDSGFQYLSHDFSAPDVTSSGWGTSFGGFATGWTQSNGTSSMTWLIGDPGTFGSVFDVLEGDGSPFDAFVFARDSRDGSFTEYAANFTASTPAIPEPETYALVLAGLGVIGALSHRRRMKPRGGENCGLSNLLPRSAKQAAGLRD